MAAASMGMKARETSVGDMNQATQSTWKAGVRTTILLASLTGLLVLLGALIGGPHTAPPFLGIAPVVNPRAYWFSDKDGLGGRRRQPPLRRGHPAGGHNRA